MCLNEQLTEKVYPSNENQIIGNNVSQLPLS